jgi:glucokinase
VVARSTVRFVYQPVPAAVAAGTAVVVGAVGNVYVADGRNNRVLNYRRSSALRAQYTERGASG